MEKKKITSPVNILIVVGLAILLLGILKYSSSPVIFVLLGIALFSAGIVRNVSLPVIAILVGIIIFNIGIVRYVSYLEDRYHCMLNNTIRLVENVTTNFDSLETDKVVKQLMARLYTLKIENETLKSQARKSERELMNISEKEKSCQLRLSRILKQKKETREPAKQASTQETSAGNKGFLMKRN